eukprot:gnl/Trimastix_PCT/757.p1 GENE.gnl/Trimastix_PCT/757~~gnl/Trimastix_PCT/757.p1  ORF type:complete len:563 (+),score=138.75 gnl/Trimastix_PCT/757:205-1893(+)
MRAQRGLKPGPNADHSILERTASFSSPARHLTSKKPKAGQKATATVQQTKERALEESARWKRLAEGTSEQLRAELRAQQEQVQGVQEDYRALEVVTVQLRASESQLRAECDSLRADLDARQKQLAGVQAEHDRLRADLGAKEQAEEKRAAAHHESAEELAALRDQVASNQQQYREAVERANALEAEKGRLANDVAAAQSSALQWEQHAQTLSTQIGTLSAQQEKLVRHCQETEDQNGSLKAQLVAAPSPEAIQRLEGQNQALSAQLAAAPSPEEHDQLRRTQQDQQEIIKQFQNQLMLLGRQLDDARTAAAATPAPQDLELVAELQRQLTAKDEKAKQLEAHVLRLQKNSRAANLSSTFPIESELHRAYETFLEDNLVNCWNDLADTPLDGPTAASLHGDPEVQAAMVLHRATYIAHEVMAHHLTRMQPVMAQYEMDSPGTFQNNWELFFPADAVRECMDRMGAEFSVDWPACTHRDSMERLFRELSRLLWQFGLLLPPSLGLRFEDHGVAYDPARHNSQSGRIRGPVAFLAPGLYHFEIDPLRGHGALSESIQVQAYVVRM